MRALLSRTTGGPETLELATIPVPTPGPGQVRIRIEAAGLNFPDTLMIEDKYQVIQERPYVPGGEFSGVIDAVGEGVTGLDVGARVVTLAERGGFAEFALADASRVFPVPDSVSSEVAASLLVTFGTTHLALRTQAGLKPGERLLVLGASGGVGTAAVSLGKAIGAHVIAGVSTEEKIQVARKAGADEVFVYPRGPFDEEGRRDLARLMKAAAGKGGADVVYDPLGGDYADPLVRALAWGGRYLVVGFVAGIPQLKTNLLLLKAASASGVFWGQWTARNPDQFRAQAKELLAMCAAGTLAPQISQTLPLDRAAEGFVALSQRSATGKIIVVPGTAA